MYEKLLVAGWGDMDFNSHMGNTAYLAMSADVRMMFFSENGFPAVEFARRRLGPVVMREEMEYFKEVGLLDHLRVTLTTAGLSGDGSRFRVRNEFFLSDGKLAAKVTSTGGWLDLSTRKLVAPPEGLLRAMQSLQRTDDYEDLPSSIK
jgi:acyl-CoA thioester hydrolase